MIEVKYVLEGLLDLLEIGFKNIFVLFDSIFGVLIYRSIFDIINTVLIE